MCSFRRAPAENVDAVEPGGVLKNQHVVSHALTAFIGMPPGILDPDQAPCAVRRTWFVSLDIASSHIGSSVLVQRIAVTPSYVQQRNAICRGCGGVVLGNCNLQPREIDLGRYFKAGAGRSCPKEGNSFSTSFGMSSRV